jgi:hypothetical protein
VRPVIENDMARSTFKIEFEKDGTINRRVTDDLSEHLTPNIWEEFCSRVDTVVKKFTNARNLLRAINIGHFIAALVLLTIQIIVWVGQLTFFKDTTVCYGRTCIQVYNYYNDVPYLLIAEVVLAIILVCVTNAVFDKNCEELARGMVAVCRQSSSSSLKFSFQPYNNNSICRAHNVFAYVMKCSIVVSVSFPDVDVESARVKVVEINNGVLPLPTAPTIDMSFK